MTDARLSAVAGRHPRLVAYVGYAELSHAQVETLRATWIKSVIVVPDPDAGGAGGALSCVRQLRDAGITPYVAPRLPDGLDPDDFVLRDGLDAWRGRTSGRLPTATASWPGRSLARHGERQPGDDAWGATPSLRRPSPTPAVCPRTRDEGDASRANFWPEIAAAVGGAMQRP